MPRTLFILFGGAVVLSWVGPGCDRDRAEPPSAEAPSPDPDSPEPVDPPAEERCAGSHLGEWRGVSQKDQLTYAADCTYTYRGADGCVEKGTYAHPPDAAGQVLVTVVTSTSGDCYPVGPYTCSYELSEDKLTFDCGEGAYTYERP